MLSMEEAGKLFDVTWRDFQVEAFERFEALERALVFYPTGKGKSKTMLTMIAIKGYDEVLVIAPPITHAKWKADAGLLGMKITLMSHAMFRQKGTKLSRKVPVICDEFHLLGGHTGVGWKKFDRAVAALKVPVIIGSATPQYNDAERVYCIVHALDPQEHQGGYLQWLYEHCITEPNFYSPLPKVIGFRDFGSAETYLESLPYVMYLPDEAPDILVDYPVQYEERPLEFHEYGVDRSRGRIVASAMEKKLRESLLQIVQPDELFLTEEVATALGILDGDGIFPAQVLVFANRSTVAKAIRNDMETGLRRGEGSDDAWYWSHGYIDGSMSTKQKAQVMEDFLQGKIRMLIGTASLATGADGMDKICDHLIIVDDTDDDALRRQLIGRILPRGDYGPDAYDNKRAYRLVYTNESSLALSDVA